MKRSVYTWVLISSIFAFAPNVHADTGAYGAGGVCSSSGAGPAGLSSKNDPGASAWSEGVDTPNHRTHRIKSDYRSAADRTALGTSNTNGSAM